MSAQWPALYIVCSSFISPAHPLHPVICVHWRGLYAAFLSAPWSCPLFHGASVSFFWFPEPAIWLGPQSVSCLWAEKCNFLCFLPSKSLFCPVSWDSSAPPWGHQWGSFPGHGNSSCFRTASLPWGTSSRPEVLHLFPYLCLHPLSYLIPVSLACLPGGLGSSAVA